MASDYANCHHLTVAAVIVVIIVALAVLAQVDLLHQVNRSKFRQGIKKCLKVLLWCVFAAVLYVVFQAVEVFTASIHVDYHLHHIRRGMSPAEVRRSFCRLYKESDIPGEDMAKFYFPDGVKVHARKYTDPISRIFIPESIYVFFDEEDRVLWHTIRHR